MNNIALDRHHVTRVRRELRQRVLTVTASERLTPQMQRIRFASPDLHDFDSAAPDDHFKLFFPVPEGTGRNGGNMALRDFTPRHFDAKQGTVTIDFALHEAGPATAWALSAKVGDELKTGGPRGSTVVADDFDWYLLIGDETALPAIGRRIEELRAGVPVTSLVTIDSPADAQSLETLAAWTSRWLVRDGAATDTALVLAALADLTFPAGDGYIWIAAESRVARALRDHVLDVIGHPPAWVKASGYWVAGEPGAHGGLGERPDAA